MELALKSDKVVLDFDPTWTQEERDNYIIHMFSICLCTMEWKDRDQTAYMIYRSRGYRGHTWK